MQNKSPVLEYRLMNKILSITNRLEDQRRKRQMEAYQDKVETIKRVIHCSCCAFKCAMCGEHLETGAEECPSLTPAGSFTMCEPCRAEFEDYLRVNSGQGESDLFWHTEEWVGLWTAWLEFQRAIRKFQKSGAFKRLAGWSEI